MIPIRFPNRAPAATGSTYSPPKAFLGGVAQVFTSLYPAELNHPRIGWPTGPGLTNRAHAAAMRDLQAPQSERPFRLHEESFEVEWAEDLRRLDVVLRLNLAGMVSGLLLGLGLVTGTLWLALAGHDTLAFGPVLALIGVMVWAQAYVARFRP